MIPTPHFAPPSARFRLRDATAQAHRQLEAAVAIGRRCADRASYRALLGEFLGIYEPLERELAAVEWDGLGIDFPRRTKTQWLRDDLLALGLSPREIAALPRAAQLPSILRPADGFGVLYVLEGASLGGQLILRQVKPALSVTEKAGASFFTSYGAEIGEYWRDFTSAMDAYGDSDTRVDAMERAALATFDCFLQWMNARAPRPGAGLSNVR